MVQFHRDRFNQMDLIHQEMNRLLDHFAGSKPPQVRFSLPVWEPDVDVYETRENLVVVVDLAGVKESDIKMTVEGDVFTVEGVRGKAAEAGERRAYHRMEISSGPFRKSIKLPVAVDTKSSQASYQDGLVEVVLPKAKRVVTRRVDVWTGRVLKQGVRDDTRR